MGKKKSKKLRRILQAQQAAQQADVQAATPAMSATEPSNSQSVLVQPVQPAVEENEVKEVRSEIRKILITVGILVLLIVAIYLANLKTDFILRLGAWLSKVLNINV